MGDQVIPTIEGSGPWRVAVADVDASAHFETDRWLRMSASGVGRVSATAEVSAGVEVVRSAGGLMPRALIGGSFYPQGSALAIEVGSTGDLTNGAPRGCRSSFSHPLVTGLPEEFAQAAFEGLGRLVDSLALPAGILRIYAAGYDEVESSALAFEHAASALGWVIQEMYAPGGLHPRNLVRVLDTW